MTTQAIGNTTPAAYASSSSNSWGNVRQGFGNLENALLNGDLDGAKSAFTSLQQTVSGTQGPGRPGSILSQLGQSDSPLGQDVQAVSKALDAGDVSGAQKAFAKLRQDMDSARQANGAQHAHHGHHHARSGDANDATASADSSATDLFNALQSLAKSNPKVAADLTTLVADLNTSGTAVDTKA